MVLLTILTQTLYCVLGLGEVPVCSAIKVPILNRVKIVTNNLLVVSVVERYERKLRNLNNPCV